MCRLTEYRKEREHARNLAGKSASLIFHRDEFVLVTDNIRVWIGRVADIFLLEACGSLTLGHFPEGTIRIRRSLGDCERRLDRCIFFRASRRYIVNLSHVKRLNLEEGGLVFVLKGGRDVALSRRQGTVLRQTRNL